jgi:hypothetical protein
MNSKSSVVGTLAGISFMFALAAFVTIVAFLSFVPPDERARPFYLWMAVVCAVEFVAFAWAANTAVAKQATRRLSGAVVTTVHVMIVIWFLVSVAAAVMGAGPGRVQSYYHDRLAAVYAVLSFLFFFAAYQFCRRDLVLQAEDAVTQADRNELRKHVGAIEAARERLRQLAPAAGDRAPRFDRLAKRLDAVRTSLDYAPPGKLGTPEEKSGAHVDQTNAQIVAEVGALKTQISALGAGSADNLVADIEAVTDRIEALLRERQRQLTS